MRKLFAALLALLGIMSLIAMRLQAPPDKKLVWVSDDNPRRKEQIELFEKMQSAGQLDCPGIPANPRTGLKLDPNNGGMEKVIVQSMGGVGSDLFDCYDQKMLSAYVRSGAAMDVTELLKQRGISVEDVWPAVKPTFVYDGKAYGLPCNAAVDALWINKDLFERAGVPMPAGQPWSWDAFLQVAHRLTLRGKDGHAAQYGFLADWGSLWQLCLLQWGGHIFSADGTKCVIDSPEAIAGVQFAHDLIYKEHVMPTPVEEASLSGQGGWGQGTLKWFGAGKGAMALGGRWWLCTLRDQTHPAAGAAATLRLSAVECPHGPLRVFKGYGRATLVNATSPRAKEALDFLVYLSRKPYNDLCNAQADALAPVKRYSETPEYLRNPDYPEEDYNAVWRDVMAAAVPEETSIFADGQAVNQILNIQMDLVKSDQKTAAAALHDARVKIDAEIQKLIAQDPGLMERYRQLTSSREHRP
jgi:ABC-type glycerol-3-phosphate transport system substrate-binding protein